MERTLLCDTDSRLLRYSWITPDYILGTQMNHPLAIHSHLSWLSIWQGMIFETSPSTLVYPREIVVKDGIWEMVKNGFFRSLQEGPVLITQQNRGAINIVDPAWFPSGARESTAYGVHFGTGLDRLEEDKGWIFVQEGDAYLAVRVASGAYQESIDFGS